MRVGFLGPEGTNAHEALRRAPAFAGGDAVALATNHDVVVAVQRGDVDAAVAPIESAREGAVAAVLDALAFDAPDVEVIGEQVLPVRYVLAAAGSTALEDVRSVASHPQALAQCASWLRRVLPDAATVAATSTADAVRSVVAGAGAAPGSAAAVGTRLAAERYGAAVLAEGIEDDPDNATRFVWLSRTPVARDPARPAKTSVLFHAPDSDTAPGWLVRCLSEFAFRGVNLTKIESRPLRSALGHYLFHLDLDGHREDPPVAEAVAALRTHGASVRVLGSYPVAASAVRSGTVGGGHGGSHAT